MESQQKRGCLICGKKTALNRGLCSTHHSRYYKEARALTDEQKARYDQELIQRGLLLPLQKPGPKVKENPFAAVAEELFAAESRETYDADDKGKRTKTAAKTARKKPPRKRAKKNKR